MKVSWKACVAKLANEINSYMICLEFIEISSDLRRGYGYKIYVQPFRGDSVGSDAGLRIGARETKSMTDLRLPWGYKN